tara:strand:+ start:96 stop:530 length:435 start_codon:yes stop_codon:yes gene_type:complete
MDRLEKKERIAKFLFASRHVDKIIKQADGTNKRIPSKKTQDKVAKAINLTFQQVQKYEKATNGVPSDILLLICETQNYDLSKVIDQNPRDLLADIDKKKHNMVLKKFKDIEDVIERERKLQERYRGVLPKLEREMAYEDTFKGS